MMVGFALLLFCSSVGAPYKSQPHIIDENGLTRSHASNWSMDIRVVESHRAQGERYEEEALELAKSCLINWNTVIIL